MKINDSLELSCTVRSSGNVSTDYYPHEAKGLSVNIRETDRDELKACFNVSITNTGTKDFEGVIHFTLSGKNENPKFYMPGYIYNRNTAEMPSSGRKAFPRIKLKPGKMPESDFWMTRSDRLALPVSLIYNDGHVTGVSAAPYLNSLTSGNIIRYCGFSCRIRENGYAETGYTLGYENAPWLFVQTATVKEREPVSSINSVKLITGESLEFSLTVYDYKGDDERAIYRAIEDTYQSFHEAPRTIPGMDALTAVTMLSSAIRDYAWLEKEQIYSGFVYDRPDGPAYNRIPSLSWTNGLAVAVPMLLAANRLKDEKAREQSLAFIDKTVNTCYNPSSGFLYESTAEAGAPTVRGWWYDGMHSGGHSSYLNGQAVYYILKAYRNENEIRNITHTGWLSLAEKVVSRMNSVINVDYEYPFSMSEKTGAGLEYDSMGGAWFLAATAMYELISGDRKYLEVLLKSENHYYNHFVKKAECYGGPLDTDKAVDSEGILSYIRAVRLLHEITDEKYLLEHLRDALYYEFTFKLGYNTKITVRPLSEIGWSCCGGSITSTANPHIHPMSSTVIDEMQYYCRHCSDSYAESRLADTVAWSLQTFNTRDKEYGYGKTGWMSERFCFCEGLLTEKYPDGETASTWFALMPWASASIIEGVLSVI